MIVKDLVPRINADVSVDASGESKDRGLVQQGAQGIQIQIENPNNCPIVIASADRDHRCDSVLLWRICLIVLLVLLGLYAIHLFEIRGSKADYQSEEQKTKIGRQQ
jgi:hypothetical protein